MKNEHLREFDQFSHRKTAPGSDPGRALDAVVPGYLLLLAQRAHFCQGEFDGGFDEAVRSEPKILVPVGLKL